MKTGEMRMRRIPELEDERFTTTHDDDEEYQAATAEVTERLRNIDTWTGIEADFTIEAPVVSGPYAVSD